MSKYVGDKLNTIQDFIQGNLLKGVKTMNKKIIKSIRHAVALVISIMVLFCPIFENPLGGGFSLFDEFLSVFDFIGNISDIAGTPELSLLLVLGIVFSIIVVYITISAIFAIIASILRFIKTISGSKIAAPKGSAAGTYISYLFYWLIAKFLLPLLFQSEAGSFSGLVSSLLSGLMGFSMGAYTEIAILGYLTISLLVVNCILYFMDTSDD